MVNRSTSQVVRQADDHIEAGEADRIRRRGRDAVISSLATQGYFDLQVTLEVGEDWKVIRISPLCLVSVPTSNP